MEIETIPLAVIGAGPCGLAVGAAAREAGVEAVLLDRGPVCASLLHYPPYMTFFSTSEKLEVGGVPFSTPAPNPSRREALAYYRGVARHHRLDIRQYHAVERVRRAPEGGFALTLRSAEGEREVRAEALVVATGGFHGPNLLGIPGEELPKLSHSYSEAHPYWGQEVLIVGGRNSAVEAALELYRTGARVTLVHFEADLDSGVKPWLLPDIRNRIANGEIAVYWRHRLVEVRPTEVVLAAEEDGRLRTLKNDFVLALTGWRPDHSLLTSLGVSIDPVTGVPEHDPTTMETPIPGLFLAGVLAAGYDANRIFIENGREHGALILARLLQEGRIGSSTQSTTWK